MIQRSEKLLLRARWLFPREADPIENGTVEIQDGLIVAVHAHFDSSAVDLGNVAIIPGLVNAHTHLEFSDCTEPVPPAEPFTDWIRAVLTRRRGRLSSATDAIVAGLRESAMAGTTCVGEIATEDATACLFGRHTPRGVNFREIIGLRPEQREDQIGIARRHLERTPELDNEPLSWNATAGAETTAQATTEAALTPALSRGERVRERPAGLPGISPHAPYSVHPDLLRGLVALAREFRAPLAMHLAETRAELELLAHGAGEFVTLLREFGIWRDDLIPRGSRPLDYLRMLAEADRALVVHGNYLAPDEIEFVTAHRHLTVVYCPRTHAWFGHREHPWRELLARGAAVALGTDSRASNPDLSLWREVQFLAARHPDVSPKLLLDLATHNGARALGLHEATGTLSPGKSADLAVIDLSGAGLRDAYRSLVAPQSRVAGAMRSGLWLSPPPRIERSRSGARDPV